MDSNCRKLGETPYRECRKQAAIYNDALGSMERAAEMLGVSVNTLSNYELGVTVPPVDIIIVMADLYCGKCGSKKQLRVTFGDKTHVVRCVCKCESKEIEERKRQEEYEEQMRRINRLKEASMMDKKYREVTFDKYEVRER